MNVQQVIRERLMSAAVHSGLANCHRPGLYSIVLDMNEDGSFTRIFYASPGHGLGRLFSEDGHFTLGAHNHDKPLKFDVLFGDVFNVTIPLEKIGPFPLLHRYRFTSALDSGKFGLGRPEPFERFAIEIAPLDGCHMDESQVHTVLVPSASAAWLVTESAKVPGCPKYIYSPRPDLKLDATGLYQPLGPWQVVNVCREIAQRIPVARGPDGGPHGEVLKGATMPFEVGQIAKVAHETNRAYCQTLGDNSQEPWDSCQPWQRESALKGVEFAIMHPDAPASAQHDAWMEDKRVDGWKYGAVKDPEKKEHPCFVPYEQLPVEQRMKDYLFKAIVNSFTGCARAEAAG